MSDTEQNHNHDDDDKGTSDDDKDTSDDDKDTSDYGLAGEPEIINFAEDEESEVSHNTDPLTEQDDEKKI